MEKRRGRGSLPPGVKIEFASREQIGELGHVAAAFMFRIFGWKPGDYAISDESRLSDFVPVDTPIDPLIQRIMDTYQIGMVPANLVLLFRELEKQLEEAKQKYPPMWTIYDHPKDHPQHIVVRVFYGEVQEFTVAVYDTLDEARRAVHEAGGTFNLMRHDTDDPAIIETWI